MTKSDTPNFQMVHIASELVALVGITFYFTSKHNSVLAEIKKLQIIVQKQQGSISQYDQKIKDLTKLVEKLQTQVNRPPNPFPQSDQFAPMGPMGPMGSMGQMGGPMGMFENPVDVIGQMMGGGGVGGGPLGGPIGGPMFAGRPQRPGNHNIQVVSDDNQQKPSTSDDAVETDSQLDEQLSDEFAELGSNSDGLSKHEELAPLESLLQQNERPVLESDLNGDRSSNNSALSINDAGDK